MRGRAGRKGIAGWLCTCLLVLSACGDNLEPYVPWTIVVLPDTQGYMYGHPEIWASQADWIEAHAEELNIQLVAHVGDVTEWDTDAEWELAWRGFEKIGKVAPFVMVPGNHDYELVGVRSSRQSRYWTADDFAQAATYGGLFQDDRTDNTYQLLDVSGEHWLVIGLEWGPRDEVLAWAGSVLDEYPERHAVIVTHAFTYSDNNRYDWSKYGNAQLYNPHYYEGEKWPAVNDGEQIWSTVIQPRSNVDLVLSGHVPDIGVGRTTSISDEDHPVQQLMADFQSGHNGGDGYLRIMTVYEYRIDVVTYSPYLDAYLTSTDHEFTLPR